jgi:hypothetical protein
VQRGAVRPCETSFGDCEKYVAPVDSGIEIGDLPFYARLVLVDQSRINYCLHRRRSIAVHQFQCFACNDDSMYRSSRELVGCFCQGDNEGERSALNVRRKPIHMNAAKTIWLVRCQMPRCVGLPTASKHEASMRIQLVKLAIWAVYEWPSARTSITGPVTIRCVENPNSAHNSD